ncbi:hypothetical protein MMC07_004642 [Pseudocyphellaria aurata]|nr:hypothetical protein [Pseudocyphellaria aurata]
MVVLHRRLEKKGIPISAVSLDVLWSWSKFRHKKKGAIQPSIENLETTTPEDTDRWRSSNADEPSETRSKILWRTRKKSRGRHADPIGLSVIYEPEKTRSLDVIFVHGLGGTSRQTWSKNRDENLFWPGRWLPSEPSLSTARILSFGYNAHFMSMGQNSIANISDFAKDLLYDMRLGKDRAMGDLGIGKVPITFVAHSMGGLVVKKAYLLGQIDDQYRDIIKSVHAILFLSTPHRGTNLAEILNKILAVSIFNHSPKQYISELKQNSPTLEDLNEQFRHVAPKLKILSFFETLYTSIGPKNIMVLEKQSSILGYPGEISKSMAADHHDVCKYTSQEDPNYISVRNALSTIINSITEKSGDLDVKQTADEHHELECLSAVSESPEDDYMFFLERWMSGTCEWIHSTQTFSTWLQESKASGVLWLHGLPASGKSIMAAYLIMHFKQMSVACQFFFFRFGDQTKRSLSALLKSLAFQVAEQVPEYRRALLNLSNDGMRLEKTDARTIWQKLFLSTLFKLDLAIPLYWIIDAIDESDSSQLLLELLSKVSLSRTSVRIIAISRRNVVLSSAFSKLAGSVSLDILSMDDNLGDIRLYVENEMQYMHGSVEIRTRVSHKILERAAQNFLWVHLAMSEILQCHTQDDIERVLEELPPGMEPLYHRMEANVARGNKSSDIEIAKKLLSWAICSRRSLTITEMAEALEPDFSAFLDLRHTISQVCGHFIVVDSKGLVSMIHQTAREYLTKTPKLRCGVDIMVGHEVLLSRCMQKLLEPQLRGGSERPITSDFLAYSATSWAFHLTKSNAGSENSLTLLIGFLQDYAVLTWIHYLATSRQLENLAYASQALALFVQRTRRLDSGGIALSHRPVDLERLELWATDLFKILGKFGATLLEDPSSIYGLIPHFCPKSSAVYGRFGKEMANACIMVSGLSNTSWDDSLARVSVGNDLQAEKVIVSDRYFAVLASYGTIAIWDAVSFEKKHTLSHLEHVSTIKFSSGGDMLVSCGFRSTKIWKISSGSSIQSIANPTDTKALDVTFAADDTIMLMGSDDRRVRRVSLDLLSGGWQILDPGLLQDSALEGTIRNSPCCISFNSNATQVAVAYRGFPLSVWTLDRPRVVNRCKRTEIHGRRPRNAWTGVNRISWNPISHEIIGIYSDGFIFKWQPLHDVSQELRANACEIACSPEGTCFATSHTDGNVKIYNYQRFYLIYQLSWENFVVDLAFSPDCRRFYDLRGLTCNVWEPNVLIRLSDSDDQGSETTRDAESTTLESMASERHVDMPSPIVALATFDRSIHCVADDDGIVHLFDRARGEKSELWRSTNQMAVQHLEWSPDATHIACTEIGGRITVKRVSPPENPTKNSKWAVTSVFDVRVQVESGGITQILLDSSSRHLLLASNRSAQIWSLETKEIVASINSKTPGISQRWINHPVFKDQVLACTSLSVVVYNWNDLTELFSFPIDTSIASRLRKDDSSDHGFPSLGPSYVSPFDVNVSTDRLMVTQDMSYVMLQSSEQQTNHKRVKDLFVFPLASILDASDNPSLTIRPLSIPPEIRARIEIPLGMLPKDQLVFLDQDYWICTWRVSTDSAPRRHYFLPKDWINAESLDMCVLTPRGTFLYPRNGDVAVIECDLGGPEMVQC